MPEVTDGPYTAFVSPCGYLHRTWSGAHRDLALLLAKTKLRPINPVRYSPSIRDGQLWVRDRNFRETPIQDVRALVEFLIGGGHEN